jgi:unsaturated rhamnogalacturonyl hydrolase
MRITSIFFILIFILCLNTSNGQQNDTVIIRSIADQVIANTDYSFVNRSTGEVYTNAKELPVNRNIHLKSIYNHWKYSNGVIHLGMLELGNYLNDTRYLEYPARNYAFFFENADYLEKLYNNDIRTYAYLGFFRMEKLDDCGALGAGMIEIIENNPKPEYKKYISKAGNFILNEVHRLDDGTLSRPEPHEMTLWLDDLYMSIPFLARMGQYTGDQKYFDFAARQVIQFTEYLFDDNMQLYFHCYYDDLKENGVARWGRANGWAAMAQAELLDFLPENHPKRDTLISIFEQQIVGFSRYQSEKGLWHQILDKPDSYLETSCTAMFVYAVAKGINEGWIDKRYRTIALQGWDGLKTRINKDGEITDVCKGTGIRDDLVFYYTRPTPHNDFHGTGAMLHAGVEILKLKAMLSQ